MTEPSIFAEPWSVDDLDECLFYHTMDIPGVGTVEGPFDLRHSTDEYLGRVTLRGKRVLEIGPASGFLTFYMERMGAEVVAVDVSEAFNWDAVPHRPEILEPWLADRWPRMERVRRSFWYAHRRFESKVKVHYGTAYELPAELGRFDVAILGAMLLHNRDPLRILQNCAAITEKTIVVVDQYDEPLDKLKMPLLKLIPSTEFTTVDTWWHLSPELLRQFLEVLGFSGFRISTHRQKFENETMDLFTLVAERV
jgi:SAM-dependent methyltransferase